MTTFEDTPARPVGLRDHGSSKDFPTLSRISLKSSSAHSSLLLHFWHKIHRRWLHEVVAGVRVMGADFGLPQTEPQLVRQLQKEYLDLSKKGDKEAPHACFR